ncbi:MAG: peptidylprolyl isomerase, partial [Thermodesulfobacteriota bacterium]
IVPFIVLSLFVASGCGRRDAGIDPPNPNVVASFSGGVITRGQLNTKFEGLMPCCKGRYRGMEGRKALIKDMVLPVVIANAIKRKKIDLRAPIREKLGNVTDELNMSFLHMKFHEQILNSNEKYADLRESYEFQKRRLEGVPLSERFPRLVKLHRKIHPKIAKEVEIVADEYLKKLRMEASITKNYEVLRVKVTEDELRDFYQQHKHGLHLDEYRVPERVRVKEIEIKVHKDKKDCPTCQAEKMAREKAEAALTELRSGAEFRTVARGYSSDTQGSLEPRWIARGSNGKEFDEAVFSLEVGEISKVFKKGDSYSIAKVLEKQPGRFKRYEEIRDQIGREYRWQKGEDYLKESRDRILFTVNGKPYTIGDFTKEYTRKTPPHQCHHMEGMDTKGQKGKPPKLCDFAHNDFEEQKKIVDRMIDRELIVEDTYNQMIHVEHQKEIEFLTMANLYPVFHREEMEDLIHITDEMVEDYYREHKEDYQYPAKAKISMIVIKGGKKKEDKEKAFERTKQAYGELKPSFLSFKKQRDFAEVARKYSDDEETASKGGLLEVDVYECRNEIEYMLLHGFHKKIFALKPGDISEVFEFGGNYYIVQIREMESRKEIPFEEVKEEVKRGLMAQEHQKVMEKWEDDLLRSAGFVVYGGNLQETLAKEPASEPKEVRGHT